MEERKPVWRNEDGRLLTAEGRVFVQERRYPIREYTIEEVNEDLARVSQFAYCFGEFEPLGCSTCRFAQPDPESDHYLNITCSWSPDESESTEKPSAFESYILALRPEEYTGCTLWKAKRSTEVGRD